MTIQLENNSISRMVNGVESASNPSFNPVIQITQCQEVKGPRGLDQKRYRIILSDGRDSCMGMLATQHNKLVEEGKVCNNTIVRVNDFMINAVNGDKKIIIVLNLDVLDNPGNPIGNPQPVTLAPTTMSQDRRNGNDNVNGSGNGNGYTNRNNARFNPTPAASHSPGNPYSRRSSGGGYAAPIMRSNVSSSGAGGNKHYYTPIKALNPYQNRWTIMARITNKSDIKHWSNSKGDGQLFSIEMLDSSGMDIRATFFRDGVDKFYNILECDKVYTFSGGKLKVANMQYNTCKCQFEITFDQNAEIHLQEDTGEITQQLYEFQPIANLESVEPGKYVDIVGIVKHVSSPSIIVSKKTGKELQKCELTIVDDSVAEVSCTVWGERAANATKEFENMPVVALRRARVSDFGGRTLSASGGNGIVVQPRVPEFARIMNWWQKSGSSGVGVRKLSSSGGGGANRFPEFDQRKTISAIKSEGLGQSDPEKPDWISFKGTVSFIKSDREGGAWYTACPNTEEPCKNRYKVQQGADGMWFCDKCTQSYDNCVHRFIFSATISDDSGTTWVSVFDDQAKVLLDGMTADALHNIYESGDPGAGQEGYEAVFKRAHFTEWVFTCKVKQEKVHDEIRLKTSIQSLHKMDYAKEGRSLLNSILAM